MEGSESPRGDQLYHNVHQSMQCLRFSENDRNNWFSRRLNSGRMSGMRRRKCPVLWSHHCSEFRLAWRSVFRYASETHLAFDYSSFYNKFLIFFSICFLIEFLQLQGYDQTRGFVQDVDAPTKIDSVMVQQIKLLGWFNVENLRNAPVHDLSWLLLQPADPIFSLTTHLRVSVNFIELLCTSLHVQSYQWARLSDEWIHV